MNDQNTTLCCGNPIVTAFSYILYHCHQCHVGYGNISFGFSSWVIQNQINILLKMNRFKGKNSIFWNERNFVFQQQILHFLSKHFKTEITSSCIINRKYPVNMIVQISYLWINLVNECRLNFCWFGIIPFPKICIQLSFEYL